MLVNFTKMHSLGNDFVVIDLITQDAKLHGIHFRKIADRNFGIGCDQIIVIEPPISPTSDFYYRIYNADGQEVEQCCNGARCAAKFVADSGLSGSNLMRADCLAGHVEMQIEADNQVTLTLDNLKPNATVHNVDIHENIKQVYKTSLGNPHGICILDDLSSISVAEHGKQLAEMHIFPNGANISFAHFADRNRVRIKVYERGVGPTFSCGSAACATFLVGRYLNKLADKITVNFLHGDLFLQHDDNDNKLFMKGPTSSTFVGRFRF